MKYNKLVFCVVIVLLSFISFGQTNTYLPDPITRSTSQFTLINCDYGPRNLSIGSNPHLGLDYKLNAGEWAFAVEDGSITDIKSMTTAWPTVIVEKGNHSFRYIHFQLGAASNNLWHSIQGSSNSRNIIIIRKKENNVLKTNTILGQSNYNGVNPYTDPLTGQQSNIQSNVQQCDSIFVAKSGSMGYHLHFDRTKTTVNPFQYVAYNDANHAGFAIIPKFKKDVNNQAIVYSNKTIYGNQVIVQTHINSTSDHDFDSLSVSIGMGKNNYKLLKGYTYTNTTHSSGSIDNVNILKPGSISQMELDVREGIYPEASSHSKEFFKFYWNSQKTKPNSANVLNLSTTDNKKVIKYDAIDIRNGVSTKYDTITLDNTKPYIKKCQISALGISFEAGWNWVSQYQQGNEHKGYLTFYTNGSKVYVKNSGVNIEVESSEGMENIDLSVDVIGNVEHYDCSPDKKKWYFNITRSQISQIVQSGFTGELLLDIEGEDVAGNALLHFTSPNNIPHTSIPLRKNDGTWTIKTKVQEKNKEALYSFFIGNSIPSAGLEANFSYSQDSEPPQANVFFTDKSTGEGTAWNWSFPGGNPSSSNYSNPLVSYPATGNYEVKLTISDDEGNQSQTSKNIYVTEELHNEITINKSVWEWYDNEYQFRVKVNKTAPSDNIDITIYFDDGSSATMYNNMDVFHQYQTPISPQTLCPYAEVKVTNEFGELIKNAEVYFGNIPIVPEFYNLDIRIMPKSNGGHISINEPMFFEASMPNAAGYIDWYWFINKEKNSSEMFCECSSGDCFCEYDRTTALSSVTNEYSFTEPGKYYISVIAYDQYGHAGSETIEVLLSSQDSKCVNAQFYQNECAQRYYFPKGADITLISYSSLPNHYTECNYTVPPYGQIYQGIGSNTYYDADGFRLATFKYDKHPDHYLGYQIGDDWVTVELDKLGKGKVRLQTKGMPLKSYPDLNTDPSFSVLSEVVKNYEVIDCESISDFRDKIDLTSNNGIHQHSIIRVRPDSTITINSGEELSLTSFPKTIIKSGTYFKGGSHVKIKALGCPEVPEDCDCKTAIENFHKETKDTTINFVKSIELEEAIVIFPNPTDAKFIIASNEPDNIQRAELLNLEGKLLLQKYAFSSEHTLMDISHLPNGIYFLRVYLSHGVFMEKIVKN